MNSDIPFDLIQERTGVPSSRLKVAFARGSVRLLESAGMQALLFKKSLGDLEAGTVIYLGDETEVIRGFPKIRRTLLLSPTIQEHFRDRVAVEEKMNGYNVRIACLSSGETVALTRGGHVCPFTTRKAQELLDLSEFFREHPDLVICGEMIGRDNPYVSQDYPEVGPLGFRVFDLREKNTNRPLPVEERRALLDSYGLPNVRLFGVYPIEEAASEVADIIRALGMAGREGVVMKDPSMEVPPLKYTSSQAHARELAYAFSYPFDFGRPFFFSRVIREGFQAYELDESDDETRERARRLGEAIIYPMLERIKSISAGEAAYEDTVIDVEDREAAEEFIRHLVRLGVSATLADYRDGRATIRRFYQSTTDRINNYLKGGLY
ncbi:MULTISPECIES: ATP-dependent RNA/DNA ligase MthRnl [Methanothermobacter]|uniref:Putative ATP-dependent DNA ligase n=1 Tax=Methanothermobacter defluvii TaxID=49339 RepID=A0A371NCC4_9EURY|nr:MULTISPECIES: ATP-dependent RNA/DNA ligase MthRnl [Methanothermobacter]MDK2874321.1 putative ATP-dependent ligase [Methanothermobacter sp.]REE28163.1 putative ATP-dependent DNA ligase [Methanothermobacter defluvii]WBF07562.1 ATP-dependent RNA/DNA ligase MthRnl [Methanothermobacter thermautotrophicus]BAM70361.1 DNA ligase [Methanothermobacter sp. CaT2]